MKSLRIVMFTTFYPPYSFGGDAVGVQRMARALVARGHDVTVVHDIDAFISMGGKNGAAAADDDGVRAIGLQSANNVLSNLLTHQLGRPIVDGKRIKEVLDDGEYDLIWYNNTSLVGGPGLLDMGDGLKIFEAHEHWLVCPTHVLWRYNRETCDAKKCWRCAASYKRPPQLWRATGKMKKDAAHVDTFVMLSQSAEDNHKRFGFDAPTEVVPSFLPDLPPQLEAATTLQDADARPLLPLPLRKDSKSRSRT